MPGALTAWVLEMLHKVENLGTPTLVPKELVVLVTGDKDDLDYACLWQD